MTNSFNTFYNSTLDSDGSLVRFSGFGDDTVIDPSTLSAELCVNYVDANTDATKYGGNFTSDPRRWAYTFLIGGATKGTTANVDAERKSAFRELILRSKPMGMWALLLINYT